MCAELFSNYKTYGRVTIREKSKTLANGAIIEIKWSKIFEI